MPDRAAVRFGVIGIDHPHVYEQVGRLLEAGAECAGWYTEGEPRTLEGFRQQFPQLARVPDAHQLFEDRTIALIVTASIPDRRAGIAIEGMEHGKDVVADKPGCTTLEQLAALRRTQAATKRLWSVTFS